MTEAMDPLSEIMQGLKEKGFTKNFTVEDNRLVNKTENKSYKAKEVQLLYEYRTEGKSNPDDLSILFAVKCNDGAKGTLVSSYGPGGDTSAIEFINFVDKTDAEEPKMI